jgi:glycosyltransferase involved in cell wall biosynthesis
MRMTFVLPFADLSGGFRVIALYADRLSRRGHQVAVVSTPPRPPGWGQRLRALFREGRWGASARKPSHFDGLGLDHRILDRARPVEETDVPDADVVIATWWKTAPWVAGFGRRKGAKAVFIQGYEVLPGESNPTLDATWRLPLRKIVVSRWLQELAARTFGDATALLVPNGVDAGQFHAPPRGKQERPTVGFLYSPSPFKDQRTVTAAVAQLRERHPALRVLAFGSVPPREGVPMPPDVEYRCLPPQDEIRGVYGACDVWLAGSCREGFGLPLLEAMACRCPVVSTRAGCAGELIVPGLNGEVVDVGDAEGLARAASGLLALPDEEWRRRSAAALETASRHGWDASVLAMEKALEDVVAAAGPAQRVG